MTKNTQDYLSFSERHRSILQVVVEVFLDTAMPVGSRTVSKKHALKLSPASIRNIMADLEELGLLYQPHHSAGRLPTSEALRFWIERLVEPRQPQPWQQAMLTQALSGDSAPKEKLERLTSVLSQLAGGAGIALAPRLEHGRLERAELIALSDARLLFIWVSRSGLVFHREVHLAQRLPSDELLQLEHLLNSEFRGATFEEVRRRLRQDVGELRMRCAMLLDALAEHAVLRQDDVIVEGVTRVVGQPDLASIEALQQLAAAFADRSTLAQILDKIAKSGGLQVLLNEETGFAAAPLGLVASPYCASQGSIGIVGSVCMPYPQVLGLVRFAANLLEASPLEKNE